MNKELRKTALNRTERRQLLRTKRRIENDAYAKDARFWAGKIKSADRTLNDKPVNRQAARELKK